MSETVVLDGELSLRITEGAELSLLIPSAAEVGIVTAFREYPEYEGPLEFVPTEEAQTIPAAAHAFMHDIIIDPIPSNYGRIDWDGAALTVS